MRAIVLASHHRLASGMADTLEFVCGIHNLYVLDAYVEGTDAAAEVAALMDGLDPTAETFVFTDMLGGSVTQLFAPYATGNVHVICGMNLPLVLEIALANQDAPLTTKQIRSIVDGARQSIIYVNEHEADGLEEDE